LFSTSILYLFSLPQDLELDIRAWLDTKLGLDQLNKEMAKRKVMAREGELAEAHFVIFELRLTINK
jgi:hypothetical protein